MGSEITVTVHFTEKVDRDTMVSLVRSGLDEIAEQDDAHIESMYFHTGQMHYRDSETGQWTTEEYTKKHPHESQTEKD